MGMEKGAGACQVVTRDLRKASQVCRQVSLYDNRRRSSSNAYYPDFAYRVDVKRKCLQVLSVVGPSKFVQGVQVESASCFNRLKAEGDAMCIEEYGKRLGFVYTNTTSTFFTAIFECLYGEDVKWVNPLPFDQGAEDLVKSLARHASEWIAFFQRNISKLSNISSDHTRLSLVLQLDVINCEPRSGRGLKMPLEVRFAADFGKRECQGAAKKQKGVRFRQDRGKWVAEYNPPGKKNNKISLGEYDNEVEALRAADAGMYCYDSKRALYNFDDSPCFLQQAPQPVRDDKEAVRKWARDFAKLTAKSSFSSSSSSWSDTAASAACLTFGNDVAMASTSLQHIPSSASLSNIHQSFPRANALEYGAPSLYDSDSSSALSFHLEDVTDYITSRDMSVPLEEDFHPGSTQINSSPPPTEHEIAFPEDSLFRNDGLDFWSAGSPQNTLIRTASDGRTVSDELFQCFMSCYPASNPEVERCSIQLIR